MIKQKNRLFFTILAVLTAVLLNGLFSYLNDYFLLPIFLDSLFTIMTAALFGLWPALIVGALSNFFIELVNGFPGIYAPFAIINIMTALVTSLFVLKKHFNSPSDIFWLIIILSIVNSLAGAIIVTFVFGGFTNLSMDNIVRGIMVAGQSIFSSAFIVRLVVNIVDKGISAIVTYIVYKAIQRKAEQAI